MVEFIIDEHLDGYVARYIKKQIFKNGVKYNDKLRKFEPVKPDITSAEFNIILNECADKIGINPEKEKDRKLLNKLIQKIQQTTRFEPDYKNIQGSIDPKQIAILQHILLKEDIAETHLLSIGSGKFIVLSTNRSTLITGDELVTVTSPWNTEQNTGFEFHIYRNNKLYIPDELPKEIILDNDEKYLINYTFKTTTVVEIGFYNPSEIFHIVDLNWDEIKENYPKKAKQEINQPIAKAFIEFVSDKVSLREFESDSDYKMLVNHARKFDISSYTLNRIIELTINKSDPTITFLKNDWIDNIPKHIIERLKEIEKAKKEKKVRELKNDYTNALKNKLSQDKFLFIFKRSGYFKQQALKELKGISDSLDQFAEEGFCEKYWAASAKNDFLKKYKVDKKDNILTAIKLIVVTVIVTTCIILYNLTKSGFDKYNETIAQGNIHLEQGDYNKAIETYDLAQAEFSPKITSFIAYFKTMQKKNQVDKLIDLEVAEGIENIHIYLDADDGLFKKHTEDLLFKLLELRPENKHLLELKDKWLNQ